jgi:hypothetical protein
LKIYEAKYFILLFDFTFFDTTIMATLDITGQLSHESVNFLTEIFSDKLPAGDLIFLLARRNPEDICIGTTFTIGLNEDVKYIIEYTLVFVTQQFSKQFDFIPRGWHTISVFKIVKDEAFFKNVVPYSDDWYEGAKNLFIIDDIK